MSVQKMIALSGYRFSLDIDLVRCWSFDDVIG